MRAAAMLLALALAATAWARDGGAVIGDGGVAIGDGGVAIGDGGAAIGDGGAAIGDGGAAIGDGGAAIGDGGAAGGDGGVAIGGGGVAIGDGGAPAHAAPRPPAPPSPRVALQRRLMTWHRALGFVTLAALAATNIIGTLSWYDKYSAAGIDSGDFAPWHEGLAIGTTAAFAATGILALVARPPHARGRRDRAHTIAMALAAAGFLLDAVIGPIAAASDGKLFQRDLALTHVVVGWSTFGFAAAGMLSYVF